MRVLIFNEIFAIFRMNRIQLITVFRLQCDLYYIGFKLNDTRSSAPLKYTAVSQLYFFVYKV